MLKAGPPTEKKFVMLLPLAVGKAANRKPPTAGDCVDPRFPEELDPPEELELVLVVVLSACTWPLEVVKVCCDRFNTLPLASTPVRFATGSTGVATAAALLSAVEVVEAVEVVVEEVGVAELVTVELAVEDDCVVLPCF